MSSVRRQYPFHLIEPKWQKLWDQQQTFRAWNPGRSQSRRSIRLRKRHISGSLPAEILHPRHVPLSHPARACTSAIRKATPPRISWRATDARAASTCCIRWAGTRSACPPSNTPSRPASIRARRPRQNIATFKRQIKSLGFSYDWSREVDTTDPKYFKWTQWIFLKLYNSWFNPEDEQGRADRDASSIPPDVATTEEREARLS